MKLAEVILRAGINPNQFPRCSKVPIKLYCKDRKKYTKETIWFIEPLFAYSYLSYIKFIFYLKDLERELSKGAHVIKPINVLITPDVVAIDYLFPCTALFFRYD